MCQQMHSYMKMYAFTRVSTITKYSTAVDKKEPTVRRERPSFSRLLCSPGSAPPPPIHTFSGHCITPSHTQTAAVRSQTCTGSCLAALRRAPAAVWPLSDGHRQLFGRSQTGTGSCLAALRRAPAAVWPLSDGHRQLFGRSQTGTGSCLAALRRAPAAVWPLSDGHRQLFGRSQTGTGSCLAASRRICSVLSRQFRTSLLT